MLPTSLPELMAIRDECYSMVNKRAGLSAGAAVVPVPGADIGADVALLMEMIPAINRRFGLSAEQIDELDADTKRFILVTASSIGSQMIGKYITKGTITYVLKKMGVRVATKSVAKYVPLIGSAIAAGVSFGVMRSVGKSHVDDCVRVVSRALEHQAATSA